MSVPEPEGNLSDWYYEYNQCGMQNLLSPEYRAVELIQTFFYPVLLTLGTVGNLTSLFLLWQLSLHAWSSCLYLAVQSLVELVILYIRCGGTWFAIVAGINPSVPIMNSSDAMCKTYLFLTNVLLQLWPWLTVALSVELMISTRFPLKTYRFCTTERARATILLIIILIICLNLNYFWTWGWVEGQGCTYIEEFSLEFRDTIWPSIEMTVKHVLPLIIISVCFLISAVSLLPSGRKKAMSYEPILKKYFLDLKALEQLKLASLAVVLFFLIVKTFTFTVEILHALHQEEVIEIQCEQRAHFYLAQTVRDASVFSFYSLKFFVLFAFCAIFRRKFFARMRKIFCCRRVRQTGIESKSVKDNVANVQLEYLEENPSHVDNVSRNSATKPDDANSHRPAGEKKTTHV